MSTRTCTRCGRSLPATVEHFQRRRDTRTGLSAECWDCLRVGWRNRVRARHPRPQTFRNCEWCGERFGPLDHLARRFCKPACAYAYRSAQPHKPRATPTREAKYAQSRIAFLLRTGRVERPERCEECGGEAALEAAHYD